MDLIMGGVNFSDPSSGGDECFHYLTVYQRLVETALVLPVAILQLCYIWPKARSMEVPHAPNFRAYNNCKKLGSFLLFILILVFAVEVSYKVRTGSLIFLLNPCHVATMLEILLFCENLLPPSVARLVFALAMYFLPGATLALLFPVVTSRKLPGEVCIYWIQHLIIVLCPVYLLSLGGVYSAESFYNFNIYVLCHALMTLYSFGPLQLISMLTNVNLNNVLCPASSDPFQGYYYRLAAIGHHSLFLILHSWLYIKFTRMILAAFENGSFIPTQLVEANGNKIHPPLRFSHYNSMVSLKQELQVLDYFGAFCVFISFFVIILIISVTCILWFCVSPTDDVTVFAKKTILRCQGGTEAAKSVKRNGKEKEEKKANFDAWPSLFMFSSVSIAMPADIYYKARLFRRGACSCVAARFVPYNKPNNTHSISTVFCRCCFPNSNNNNNNNRTKSDCSCERCLAGGLSLALQDWNALRAINCFLPRWEKQQPATVEDEQNSCVLERTELRKRDMNELWDQSLPVSHIIRLFVVHFVEPYNAEIGQHSQNVTDVTLNRYNVRALPSLDGLIFPRYSVTLEMMGSQIRPSGLKICRLVETINMMTVADEVLPSVSTFNGMFGYHLVRQSDSEVVLTLNEADAMSIFQACSKLAVVLPDNPGHFNVEVLFLPYLEEFTKITLWLPPEKYNRAKQLSKKLLSNQCYLISPKACNNLRAAETLAIPGKGRELINGVIRQGEAVVHKYVDTLAMLRDPVRSFLFGYNGQTCGVVQWKRFSLLNSYLKGFRLGELTLLTGPFGCGKKTFLCEYALDLCDQNMVTLWCGLELPSIRVVATMIEQYARYNLSTSFDDQRRISQGSLATAIIRLLAIEYHASAQDVQHVVIDNALLIHDCSSQTFTELKRFASSKNLHITAIVHPKKVPLRILLEVENPIGTISAYSIYSSLVGAYEADNILQITTHINKNQQQQCELEKYLQIWKNRNVGELLIGCLVEMHFDPLSKCHSLVMRKKKIRPGCVD
ncbi:Twinkle protein, mitochondrial [Trichinella spiralis]|uniref:Twinkle protein, mitochondrial n=2 Tax=Trichinella TaxID=6333 RepID=A0A0V1BDK3_TRISP|nr:Twinkle protein, mitochondrial [Trichinella spiralis]